MTSLARLVDVEFHAVEFEQEVVGKFDVGLVDLVDQQHRALRRREGLPELAALDIVGDVRHARIAELGIPEAGHRVIFIEALLCLGGRFDVPGDERGLKGLGDFLGEDGLAGAGLALHQERPLEHDGGIDGDLEIFGGDIACGTGKAHEGTLFEEAPD